MQRRRFQRLALHTVRVQRFADHLQVEFASGFPRHALEEALAVERQCCPFFLFEFDEASRRLRVSVQDTYQGAALEVLASSSAAGSTRATVRAD